MKTPKNEILEMVRGSIIVSCQALPVEPMYCEEMSLMPFMAMAAKEAGSRCIRTSSVRDVIAIKEKTGLPVIGLVKQPYEGYEAYITPTMKEIDDLMANFKTRRLHFLGTDMATNYMRPVIDEMDDAFFDLYLKYHFTICERADCVGVSHHFLDIHRKNS